jgi:uncharacterized protein YjgD (DUF1641 family)
MTASTTSSIEARLERIERSLEKISTGLEQGPVMLSMAADSFDEIAGNARDQGIDLGVRLKDGMHLLKRLSDPEINKGINGLIDTLEQAPGLISMFIDIADESAGQYNKGPIKLNDRIAGLLSLLDKISDPETIQNINILLEKSQQTQGLIAMAIDTFDDVAKDNSLLDSKNLEFLKNIGESLQEAIAEPPAKIGGLFSLLRAINDDDRQKAIGLLMNVLKKLGNKL